jgi:glycosyltransferase involved in cell wall biosynthesis
MPRVTVVLSVFNGAETLAKSLQSALNQTYQDFSILVLDDGSTDESATIARQANQGLGAGRKRLVEEADGGLIAFLDHDDFWVPDKLKKQVALLDETGAAMVHSDCIFMYSDTGKSKARRLSISDGADAFDHILPSNRVIASSAVFRRGAMLEAGNFIADTVRCSDWYGWFLLAAKGKFLHLPEVQVEYTVRAQSLANAGYTFHKAQHDLLQDWILPRFEELFARCGASQREKYRKMILKDIGIAASSMAKHLGKMGRREEAKELHRKAMSLAGSVPRVWTRALRSRLRG